MQLAATGASNPVDFRSIALLEEIKALSREKGLDPRTVLVETIEKLSNATTDTTVAQAWEVYEREDFANKYEKTTKGTNRPILNAFASRYGSRVVGSLTCENAYEYSKKLQDEGKVHTTIETYMGVGS